MSKYNIGDIPDYSDEKMPDLAELRNVMPQKTYSLYDVAEAYATINGRKKEIEYKRLEKFFSSTGIFKPSPESGEYEFEDIILPIAAHIFYRKKNRKYDLKDENKLSNRNVFNNIYYPLFKAKVYGHDEIIDAYSKYRNLIVNEFKNCLDTVNEDYLITSIKNIVSKSSMRLNLRVIGADSDLINKI